MAMYSAFLLTLPPLLVAVRQATYNSSDAQLGQPNMVYAVVYDLLGNLPFLGLNRALKVASVGVYHVGIEVYGVEVSFGGGQPPQATGVFITNMPGVNAVHHFYQKVELGKTAMTPEQFDHTLWILQHEPTWRKGNYDIIKKNCIEFSREFAHNLGVNPLPSWITNSLGIGQSLAPTLRALNGVVASVEGRMMALSEAVSPTPDLYVDSSLQQMRAVCTTQLDSSLACGTLTRVVGQGQLETVRVVCPPRMCCHATLPNFMCLPTCPGFKDAYLSNNAAGACR